MVVVKMYLDKLLKFLNWMCSNSFFIHHYLYLVGVSHYMFVIISPHFSQVLKLIRWKNIKELVNACYAENMHDDVIKWKHFPRYWPFVNGGFPAQRPETRSFDAFLDLRLNKRFSKQSWGWWFEIPSRSLWRHCNGLSWSVSSRLSGIYEIWDYIY